MVVVIKAGTQQREPKQHRALIRISSMPAAFAYFLQGGFQQDLETVLDTGVTVACLARSVGMSRSTVSRWRSGKHDPREPITMLAIRLEAERIRKEKEEENINGHHSQ